MSYQNEIYRKLIHLSSLWMVMAIYLLSKTQVTSLFALIMVSLVLFEIGRRHSRLVRFFTLKYIGHILRRHELCRQSYSMTGAFYAILAGLLSVILFSPLIAMTAVAVMVLSDTAAALIGRRFGTIKIMDKSLQGSLAFFTVSLVIVLTALLSSGQFHVGKAIIIAGAATLTELYSKKLHIDDNLSIALTTGAAMLLCL